MRAENSGGGGRRIPANARALYLSCAPPQPNAVLTCGTDGCVRLFNALGRQPALRVYASRAPLLGVAWSPHAPLVFAASAGE